MPVAQSFNKILLTTSNTAENNILLQEISGQLYINNHLVVTADNIASLTTVTNIESDVSTLQTDTTSLQTSVSTLQTQVDNITKYNISTRDTEANILASSPTNPTGEVTIAYGTDTQDFYIWDGSAWYVYHNDSLFANTYSLSFDGTNDYMSIPDSTALETTAFTWSAWFYCTVIGRHNPIVDTSTSSSFFNGYHIRVNNTNVIRFASYHSSDYIDSTTTVAANTWYHIAATHESGSDKLYVNGSLEASSSASNFQVTDAVNLRIGSSSLFSMYHQGLIDDAAFFNYALSASDVSSIYNSGTPADISSLNPVGWWRMGDNDSGTGTTITDQGSGGNNGTLTNGPTFSTTVPS